MFDDWHWSDIVLLVVSIIWCIIFIYGNKFEMERLIDERIERALEVERGR